jgi:hypothetical protein
MHFSGFIYCDSIFRWRSVSNKVLEDGIAVCSACSNSCLASCRSLKAVGSAVVEINIRDTGFVFPSCEETGRDDDEDDVAEEGRLSASNFRSQT